jgi:hypothetical protein
MTHFIMEQVTEQSDTIYVEIDHRFNVAIVRNDTGMELRVYPRSGGELWDFPFVVFEVDESEVNALEAADGLNLTSGNGGNQ